MTTRELIIDDIYTESDLHLILTEQDCCPPEPKVYTVDIPGGNGVLDLTDALSGETNYGNRIEKYSFVYIDDKQNFEDVKRLISNFLHGQEHSYRKSFDENYTYKGRFTITNISNEGMVYFIEITVDAEPYKYMKKQILGIDATGGVYLNIPCGKKRVRPKFETDGFLRIVFNEQVTVLPRGTWTVNHVVLTPPITQIYLNNYEVRSAKWSDLKGMKVADVKKYRWFEIYKNFGDETVTIYSWDALEGLTFDELESKTWHSLDRFVSEEIEPKNIYIEYDWGDL